MVHLFHLHEWKANKSRSIFRYGFPSWFRPFRLGSGWNKKKRKKQAVAEKIATALAHCHVYCSSGEWYYNGLRHRYASKEDITKVYCARIIYFSAHSTKNCASIVSVLWENLWPQITFDLTLWARAIVSTFLLIEHCAAQNYARTVSKLILSILL